MQPEKLKVNDTQYKILHLLNNLPPQKRTTLFLSLKCDKHPSTIRQYVGLLKEMGLVSSDKSESTGRVHYYLNPSIKYNIDLFVTQHTPPPKSNISSSDEYSLTHSLNESKEQQHNKGCVDDTNQYKKKGRKTW